MSHPNAAWTDNGIPRLYPVPSSAQAEVLKRLRGALGPSGLDETVCAVCDTWVLYNCCKKVKVSDREMIDSMRSLLSSAGENLPEPLMAEYDCTDMVPELKGILLSKAGVDDSGALRVCQQCSGSLAKLEVPKFSIKNGFYIGSLPADLQDVTLPERLMTQLVSVVAVTRVMRGGIHRAIRSHCLAFDATPGPPATLLPSRLDGVSVYRVVLAGPFTTAQQARMRKLNRVRRSIVDDLLAFYCANNPFYAGIAVDCSRLEEDQVPIGIVYEERDAEVAVDDMDVEGERVGGASDRDATTREDEVMERRVVFVADDREISTESSPSVVEQYGGTSSTPQFLVRHSSRFTSHSNDLFARMFPHLFPHGRGHPGEERLVPVSFEACIRHYSMLSSRRFAQDELFLLIAFDHISLQKMYTQVALKCKRNPSAFERYSDVAEEDLVGALREKELQRQGRTAAARGTRSAAGRLLDSVELSGGAIWGSDAERAQCRRRAFAYQTRYGQPALFVTLTPNVSESFVMAQYCGVTSVDSLFDANLSETPGKAVLQSACLRNDVASARLFMHNMDAFVDHVLGVSPDTTDAEPFDGLFGKVKAYFGMVETQGGGTLHAHFLVWLAGAPPNSTAFELAKVIHGEQYSQDVVAYAESVVSTALPLDIAESTCLYCGHTYADLEVLPIPGDAYTNPDRRRGGAAAAEPLLVQCPECKTKTSAQHVLRRVLLQHRPSLWPPRLREYSANELADAIARETPCRGSTANARRAIFRRDSYISGRDDGSDSEGDRLRVLNRAPQRSERRHDDVFRDDEVARALQTMPPSLEDARWPPQAFAFAVSMLVFLVNLHWWSHVGSCFKRNRSADPGRCRYKFPRGRVAEAGFTSDGIVIARRPACEYVNGFNPVMMAAFKSNHDSQVMIGGAAALLRIYYATKYVTKAQDVVESVTAVALAAFQRRQARERLVDDEPSDRASVGRKRVASLTFALSNRREIAGPLAALYLLRGSCCYMSTPCAPLPLADILKALTHDDEEHACDLVALNDWSSTAVYRPASSLDDYRYRPLALQAECLYAFATRYFRRKRTKSTRASALFQAAHPLSDTHCIGVHRAEVVPVINGVRVPFVDAASPSEKVVKRSRCALALFKPFRVATDLASNPSSDDAWVNSYREWEPTRSSFVCELMANMDDCHRGNELAREAASSPVDDPGSFVEDEVTGTRVELDALAAASEAAIAGGAAATDPCSLCDEDAFGFGDEVPVFPTFSAADKSAVPASTYEALLRSSAATTASAFASLSQLNTRDIAGLTADEVKQWLDRPSTDEAQPTEHVQAETLTEVVDLLASALNAAEAPWVPPDGQPQRPSVAKYASIADVSRAYTLNQKQHVAFTIIATALLRQFLRQEQSAIDPDGGYSGRDFQAQLRDEQLLMFLGGPGGTGKSRIVDAVTAFCASWHHEDSLVKTALTGKAATLIGARTLASFLMRIERAIKAKSFAPINALVIDEVSMMSKPQLLRLDKLLRAYKQVLNVPFGGVHVVLVGDFLQMPPVGADAIFVEYCEKRHPSVSDVDGFNLWRQFTTAVVLEESVRFRSDPEWGEGCRQARLGEWTPAFVRIINARVMQQKDAASDLAPDGSVFVTPENAKRLAINNAFIAQVASKLPANEYPLRVLANFKGALNTLSRSDVAYVLGLPDNRFGRLAPYLDLIDGMPVQVTQNVGTAKGVANGTLGDLDSVHFASEPDFRLVRDGATGMIVRMASEPPAYALLRLPRPRAVPLRPGLDAELFPVFFATEAYSKSKIPLPAAPSGQRRYLEVKPQQFPFVCAVGSTVYKVQGETLQSMVVVDWTSTNNIINKPQQSYLLVSRVTSRNAFLSLSPFTAKLAKWSKPPQNALDEEKRLTDLSNLTLAAYPRFASTGFASTSTSSGGGSDAL